MKNLSELKRILIKDKHFKTLDSINKNNIGQIRKVTKCDTTGIYSIILNKPESEISTCNNGNGIYLEWKKASNWTFNNNIANQYSSANHDMLLISIEIL